MREINKTVSEVFNALFSYSLHLCHKAPVLAIFYLPRISLLQALPELPLQVLPLANKAIEYL